MELDIGLVIELPIEPGMELALAWPIPAGDTEMVPRIRGWIMQ